VLTKEQSEEQKKSIYWNKMREKRMTKFRTLGANEAKYLNLGDVLLERGEPAEALECVLFIVCCFVSNRLIF
jgi:hypothetical protein